MNERTTAEIMADLRGKRSLFQAQRDEAADRLEALDRLFTAVHEGNLSRYNGESGPEVVEYLRSIR